MLGISGLVIGLVLPGEAACQKTGAADDQNQAAKAYNRAAQCPEDTLRRSPGKAEVDHHAKAGSGREEGLHDFLESGDQSSKISGVITQLLRLLDRTDHLGIAEAGVIQLHGFFPQKPGHAGEEETG